MKRRPTDGLQCRKESVWSGLGLMRWQRVMVADVRAVVNTDAHREQHRTVADRVQVDAPEVDETDHPDADAAH